MIDRKIAKLKARRGTEAQRVQVIFEEGELCYTTDTEKLYIGDGVTYGGNPASSKGYIVSSSLSSVPSFASKGDTIFSKESGLTYIVDLSGSTLILRQIGSNFDPNSISALNVTNGSVGLSGLNSTVVAISGGIGFTSVSGLFIRYDPLTLTLENGLLKVLPQGSGGTAYQFNTLNGGITIGNNATVSVDVDNSTIQIVNNKLSAVGVAQLRTEFNALTASNSTTFSSYVSGGGLGYPYSVSAFPIFLSPFYNTGVITKDNSLVVWGNSEGGRSGIGLQPNITAPLPTRVYIENSSTYVKVIQAFTFTYVLMSDGTVWTTGYNGGNQLGIGSTNAANIAFLTKINFPASADISDITTTFNGNPNYNYNSCLALDVSGRVYSWGYNGNGSCGFTSPTWITAPVDTGIRGAIAIYSTGHTDTGNCSFVLLSGGTVLAAGYNAYNQLGVGVTGDIKTFQTCLTGLSSSYAASLSCQLGGIVKMRGNPCAGSGVFLINSSGEVWASGDNRSGEFADGTTTTSRFFKKVPGLHGIKDVAQSGSWNATTIMAISSDDSLVTWGYNFYGQVGKGTTGAIQTSAYKTNITNIKKLIPSFSSFTQSGQYSNGVVTNDGYFYICGFGGSLGLGNGTNTSQSTFTKVKHYKNNITDAVIMASGDWAGTAGSYGMMFTDTDGRLFLAGLSHFYWTGKATGEHIYFPSEFKL
jgi:alpha-tubulin suppressor-like RCC1 family protein